MRAKYRVETVFVGAFYCTFAPNGRIPMTSYEIIVEKYGTVPYPHRNTIIGRDRNLLDAARSHANSLPRLAQEILHIS